MLSPVLIAAGQIGAPTLDGAPAPFIMLPGPSIGAIVYSVTPGLGAGDDGIPYSPTFSPARTVAGLKIR